MPPVASVRTLFRIRSKLNAKKKIHGIAEEASYIKIHSYTSFIHDVVVIEQITGRSYNSHDFIVMLASMLVWEVCSLECDVKIPDFW